MWRKKRRCMAPRAQPLPRARALPRV